MVTRGVMHQPDELPGFIALYHGEPKGLLTYSHKGDELEVATKVASNALRNHIGSKEWGEFLYRLRVQDVIIGLVTIYDYSVSLPPGS